MLFEEPDVRNVLRAIVQGLDYGFGAFDDLMQEAMICLWLLETTRPAQTLSWYLQGCSFHIRNVIQHGRSVDSRRRRCNGVSVPPGSDGENDEQVWLHTDYPNWSEISARDILRVLKNRLSPGEVRVLDLLAKGFGTREIARRLCVSHQAVSKCRIRIADHATRCGITLQAG